MVDNVNFSGKNIDARNIRGANKQLAMNSSVQKTNGSRIPKILAAGSCILIITTIAVVKQNTPYSNT